MPELFDVAPLLDRSVLQRAKFIAAARTIEQALREARKAFPACFIYCGGHHFAVHRASGEPALFRVKVDR